MPFRPPHQKNFFFKIFFLHGSRACDFPLKTNTQCPMLAKKMLCFTAEVRGPYGRTRCPHPFSKTRAGSHQAAGSFVRRWPIAGNPHPLTPDAVLCSDQAGRFVEALCSQAVRGRSGQTMSPDLSPLAKLPVRPLSRDDKR